MKAKLSFQSLLLLLVVLVAFIGITISYPIFTPMFLHPGHNGIIPFAWHRSTRCILLGVMIAIYPLGQFLGSPILGGFSDQNGRKPALIFTLLGACVGYLFTALSIYQNCLWLFITSRFLTGFLEGNIAIARSAAGDLNSQTKHRGFGNISAAATTGNILGPIIGGGLSDSHVIAWFSFYLPFLFAAILLLIIALLTLFFFEETLSADKRAKPTSIVNRYKIISRVEQLGHNSSLKHFLIIWICITIATDTFTQFFPAFLVGKWNMSPLYIAIFNASLCVWYVIGSVWFVPYLSQKIKTVTAINIGILFYGLSLILMLIPEKSYYLFPIFIICDLSVAIILINSFVHISDLAKQEHQGEALGLTLGLRNLSDTIIAVFGGLLIFVSTNFPLKFSVGVCILISIILFKKSRVKVPEILENSFSGKSQNENLSLE